MNKLLSLIVVAFCFHSYNGMAKIYMDDEQDETYTSYYKKPSSGKPRVSNSVISYKGIATKITEGCNTDYQRIKAIYQWLCDHIVYDTSFKIVTADECYSTGKGVCQAYNELFYQLAKGIGIKVEVIDGVSKDKKGNVENFGHSWLFAYTSEDHGIFMDPTWGAGYLDGNRFVRKRNCWTWFNVAPEWLILSHFPREKEYQLIDNPMNKEEFLSMSPVSDLCLEYGMNVHDIYKSIREEGNTLPQLYSKGEGLIDITDLPLRSSLKVGEQYTFRIRLKADCDLSLNNNTISIRKEDWKDEGDSIYSLHYMVRDVESLSIGVKDETNDYWNVVVNYSIEQPTEEDWKKVEDMFPLSAPDIMSVKSLYTDRWNKAGVDDHKLVSLIREHHVSELPMLFFENGQDLTIVSVPMTKELQSGVVYSFSFYPKAGVKWAVVNNNKWYTDWQISDDGMYSMSITPTAAGPLYLYVQIEQGQSYWPCMQYEVVSELP